MAETESVPYFNSFDINISAQSEKIHETESRMIELRQRLMQFGGVMTDLERIEKEMQHKQQMRAQHAFSQQLINLSKSIKNEKIKMKQIREKANDFLVNECKKKFIQNTKDLYDILSIQYVESQHDIISKYSQEIKDIKSQIKCNPSQILRLFYILFSINDINNLSNKKMNNETITDSLIKYIAGIIPSIKKQYISKLDIALRHVSWPKIGDQKIIDVSSPTEWSDIEMLCGDLFGIEYYLRYINDNSLWSDVFNKNHINFNCNKSWVCDVFLAPIIKRFDYNFNRTKSNSQCIQQPQYFLSFALQLITDNMPIIKELLSPLMMENGLDLNIELLFITGIINCVRKKCKHIIELLLKLWNDALRFTTTYSKRREIYQTSAKVTRTAMKGMKVMSEFSAQSLQSLYSSFGMFNSNNNDANDNKQEEDKKTDAGDDDETEKEKRIANDRKYKYTQYLIRHLINELIKFQIKLLKSYPDLIENNEATNIMNEVLCNEILSNEWLQMEKDRINSDSILYEMDTKHIFGIYHNEFMNKKTVNYFMTNAMFDTLNILQSIYNRVQTINNIHFKYKFAMQLMMQFLKLCTCFIKEEFPKYIHYRSGMKPHSIAICCGIINSSDYLAKYLKKWNQQKAFQALSVYKQMTDEHNPLISTQHVVTQQDIIHHSSSLSSLFFDQIIEQHKDLLDEHMSTLSDVICHEFITESGHYLNETFGYTHFVESQHNESNYDTIIRMQYEFEDAYYKLCELLYLCFESLPNRLFEALRDQISHYIDTQLMEKILKIKVTFFEDASHRLKYDLQHMFALFYIDTFCLIPNYKPISIEKMNKTKFPKLIALLRILTMNEMELNQFMHDLSITKTTGNNDDNNEYKAPEINQKERKQMLGKYAVDALSLNTIKTIANKRSTKQILQQNNSSASEQDNDNDNDNDNDSNVESDFSDF